MKTCRAWLLAGAGGAVLSLGVVAIDGQPALTPGISVAVPVDFSGAVTLTTTVGSTQTMPPVTPVPPVVRVAPTPEPTRTLINDAAWRNSAAVDLSHPRAAVPARLVNVSVRGTVNGSGGALVAGAVVSGEGTLPSLVRAIGPGLANYDVPEHLFSPTLAVYRSGSLLALTNTLDTPTANAGAYAGAFPALPSMGGMAVGDAAMVGTPAAGMLSARCTTMDGNSGVAMVEFYDIDANASATSAHFTNFSASAHVAGPQDVLIAGFVVGGEGKATLLLRGVGASLQPYGVGDAIADPTITLYSGNTPIATNDDWQDGADSMAAIENAARATGAFALTSNKDAALLVTLPAGGYTLHVRAVGASTGSAAAIAPSGTVMAEIYQVSATARLDSSQFDPELAFDAARATNATGLDIFRRLQASGAASNVVISPYSIESALALAYAGADGTTRDEMARVLHLPSTNFTLQQGFATLRAALTAAADHAAAIAKSQNGVGIPTDTLQWNAANRLFGQTGYAFRDGFLKLMDEGFAAPMQTLDFASAPDASRATINDWVEGQTQGRIVELLPPGSLDKATALVIVNALYLKAPWTTPFTESLTSSQPFHLTPATSVPIPTMHAVAGFPCTVENGLTIVSLNYLGNDLSFVVILPQEGMSIQDAASRVTLDALSRWSQLMADGGEISLYLPKCKLPGSTVALGGALRALGMNAAFNVPVGSANFDGIAPRLPDRYLYVSDVYHQTFLALDEKGTEAAAATAVTLSTTVVITPAQPPLEVRVDRPFLFAIQHRKSGACLFFGTIGDPR